MVLNPEQQEKIEAMKEDRREQVRDRLAFRIANLKELALMDQQVSQIKAIRAEYRPRVQEAGNRVRATVRDEIAAVVTVLRHDARKARRGGELTTETESRPTPGKLPDTNHVEIRSMTYHHNVINTPAPYAGAPKD